MNGLPPDGFELEGIFHDSRPQRHPFLERASQVVSIVSGLVVIVVSVASVLKGCPWYLVWILVVSAAVLILSVFAGPVGSRFDVWLEARKDKEVTRSNWPDFISLIRRFADFVNTTTNDTLHHIVLNDMFQGRADRIAILIIPDSDLWFGSWQFFMQRVSCGTLSMPEFRQALFEFHFIAATYNNKCVMPIFERMPQDLLARMSPSTKSKLNLFQQKFSRFLQEYQEFAKPLSQSRPALQGIPYSFMIPKPLA